MNPSSAQDRGSWTFYTGKGNWSSQVRDAISVFDGDNILSVSWNNYLQQYLAVYSQVFSQSVMMRTSPSPEGPWSAETVAFAAMVPSSGSVYDAHGHPEHDANGGQTVLVTYSRATAPFASEVRLVELTLQRTGAPASR